jgi:tetratricopeptide (TPR) repeat protein
MRKFLSAEATLKDYVATGTREVALLEGHVLFGLSEFDQALALYEGLLSKNNADTEALFGKAKVRLVQGDVEGGLKLLQAIKLGADSYVKAQVLIANIHIKRNKIEQAEATLSDLLSLMPSTDILLPEKAMVLERLSYVLTRQGRTNEAYIYTKLLTEAFPGVNEVQTSYKTALEQFQAGEITAAKTALEAILKDYPHYNKAKQILGVISYLEGDTATASNYLDESVDPETASAMATHIYAATNLKLNDPKKVLEILESTIDRTKIPETLALYGLAALSDKQFEKGEKALLKALKIDPKNSRIRLALSSFYRTGTSADKGKEWQQLKLAFESAPLDKNVLKEVVSYHLRFDGVKKAQSFINDALKSNANDYATNLIAGYFAVNQKNVDQAVIYFSNAVKARSEGPEYTEALFAQGRAEATLKKFDAAEATFKALISVSPFNVQGYKGLLSVYIMAEGYEKAQQKFAELPTSPENITAVLVLIQASVAKKDVGEAKKHLEVAKNLNSEHKAIKGYETTIHYLEAAQAMQQQKYDDAREFIAPVLLAQPDNIRVLSFLVDLELKTDNVKEATKVLSHIEELNPNHPLVELLKGEVALQNKDYPAAKQYFSQSWENNATELVASKLHAVLGKMKETSEQEKLVSDWLQRFPNSPRALLFQSVNQQLSGNKKDAVVGYEKILKIAPNNVLALNNLGWIYFEQGNTKSLELLKKAVELSPNNASVLDSYGWVLAKNGQIDEGLVYLEKANKLSPGIKEIMDHIAAVKKM